MQSWHQENYYLTRVGDWPALQAQVENEQVALLICSLDAKLFQSKQLRELLTASNSSHTRQTLPVLLTYSAKNPPQSLLDPGHGNVEICHLHKNLDYLSKRIDYLLTIHSVSDQQSRKLTEWQNLNQAVVESAGEGIVQYDDTGTIQSLNPKSLKILGYSEHQLLGTCVFDLLGTSEDDAAEAEELIAELTRCMLQHKSYSCNRVLLKTARKSHIVAEICCNCILDADGFVTSHVLMFQDITARTINEERLIKLAKYDVLTGLANRSKFHDFTEGKIAYCQHNDKNLALLFIDVDHFKNINDTMGHDAGDELLIGVAERLRSCVRETDLVARIGGDEFAITLLEIGNPNQVTRIVRHVLDVLTKPFFVQGREVGVSASVGISLYPESGADLGTLTKTADTAMHQAKADGRNTYRFFSTEIQNRVMEQTSLEDALRKAINNDEFFIHYQPQIDAVSGRVVGLESLIRWQHADWPDIGPHKFIPVAEECGLLPAMGRWVLLTACRQAVEWLNDPNIRFDFPIAVNLSPKQLVGGDFQHQLEQVLIETGVPPKNLVLELTETAVMHNPDAAIDALDQINAAGVKISVDDFGTGYSSLNYLKKLPISKLKIDRSFVKDIGVDANGEAIVKAILALAHSLNLEVVAEGVEEECQVDFLRAHSCELLQGFYFSRPMATAEITEMLRAERGKWESLYTEVGKQLEFDPLQLKPPMH